MKKMIIFEPAMCCSTGVCGPSVDPELLRISTTINNLKSKGIDVERYNLASSPQKFVEYKPINEILGKDGISVLPITMVDEQIVKMKAYPTDKEFIDFLGVSEGTSQITKKSEGCCGGGCC